MLTFTAEDDFGGENEMEKYNLLELELCPSNEISEDEKLEQFDDVEQPIAYESDSAAADANSKEHSFTSFDGKVWVLEI